VTLALLGFCLQGSSASAQIIRGALLDRDSNQPIALGRIVLISESGDSVDTTLSNARGLFEVSSLTPGAYYLKATSLGYQDSTVGIFDLGASGTMSLEFRLRPKPLTLEEIVVKATGRPVQQGALIRNGFYDRMTAGLGRFITPADIGKSAALKPSDLFYGLGRVEVLLEGGRSLVRMLNPMGPCIPAFFVDGFPLISDDGDVDALISLTDVEAVEVYRGSSELPLQYGGTTTGGCGAVVIWTKGWSA
jgi:hypothetical protein